MSGPAFTTGFDVGDRDREVRGRREAGRVGGGQLARVDAVVGEGVLRVRAEGDPAVGEVPQQGGSAAHAGALRPVEGDRRALGARVGTTGTATAVAVGGTLFLAIAPRRTTPSGRVQ